MFAQIVIDCQTPNEYVSCSYCIGKENCELRMELGKKETNLPLRTKDWILEAG